MLKMLLAFPKGNIRDTMIKDLKEDPNYDIQMAETILETLNAIRHEHFDIVLCEMQFTDGTGLDFKRSLNEFIDIPTIFVSEVNDKNNIVIALEYGGDDYVTAPFYMIELKARIRAVLRRYQIEEDASKDTNILKLDPYEFNIVGRRVKVNNKDIGLTGREFDILFILISNYNFVFSRKELALEIWGDEWEGHLRTVDVHIKRLREKLGEEKARFIRTKWGQGYYYGEQ